MKNILVLTFLAVCFVSYGQGGLFRLPVDTTYKLTILNPNTTTGGFLSVGQLLSAAGGGGGGNTIYSANDVLTSNRTLGGDGFDLTFDDIDTYRMTSVTNWTLANSATASITAFASDQQNNAYNGYYYNSSFGQYIHNTNGTNASTFQLFNGELTIGSTTLSNAVYQTSMVLNPTLVRWEKKNTSGVVLFQTTVRDTSFSISGLESSIYSYIRASRNSGLVHLYNDSYAMPRDTAGTTYKKMALWDRGNNNGKLVTYDRVNGDNRVIYHDPTGLTPTATDSIHVEAGDHIIWTNNYTVYSLGFTHPPFDTGATFRIDVIKPGAGSGADIFEYTGTDSIYVNGTPDDYFTISDTSSFTVEFVWDGTRFNATLTDIKWPSSVASGGDTYQKYVGNYSVFYQVDDTLHIGSLASDQELTIINGNENLQTAFGLDSLVKVSTTGPNLALQNFVGVDVTVVGVSTISLKSSETATFQFILNNDNDYLIACTVTLTADEWTTITIPLGMIVPTTDPITYYVNQLDGTEADIQISNFSASYTIYKD